MDQDKPITGLEQPSRFSKFIHPLSQFNLVKIIFILSFAAIGARLLYTSFANETGNELTSSFEASGILQVVVSDDFKGSEAKTTEAVAGYEYSLKTDNGETLKLTFPSDPTNPNARNKGPDITGGSKVHIKGKRTGDTVLMSESGGTSVTTVSAATVAPVTGTRKVAVILFNFTDDTSQLFTPAAAKAAIFGPDNSVKSYYQKNSNGKFSIAGNIDASGDVFGWITLNLNKAGGCSYSSWGQAADEAIKAKGVDMSAYNHIIYSFPQAGCGWGGIAQLPGTRSYNLGGLGAAIHEIGHNLGMAHSNGYACLDSFRFLVEISTNCASLEYYGNDVMGSSVGDLNAYHKEQLGWLVSSDIQSVTTSGDYTIATLGSNVGAVQAIKIPRIISRKTINDYYYLEYRQRGLVINEASIYNANPNVLDLAPELLSRARFSSEELGIGRTFSDNQNKITILPLSATATEMKVRITIGRATASADNAACEINSSTVGVVPGSTFSTSFTMKNTGTTTWRANDYQLGMIGLPSNMWAISRLTLSNDVLPGGTAIFNGTFIAPVYSTSWSAAGFSWRMVKNATSDWFGTPCIKGVAVNEFTGQHAGPIGLRTTNVSSINVALAWAPPTPNNIWLYKVIRTSTTRTGTATYLAGLANSTPGTFENTGLQADTAYTYTVVGLGSNGIESLPSQSVVVRTSK